MMKLLMITTSLDKNFMFHSIRLLFSDIRENKMWNVLQFEQ